jgi:hypothetical protein
MYSLIASYDVAATTAPRLLATFLMRNPEARHKSTDCNIKKCVLNGKKKDLDIFFFRDFINFLCFREHVSVSLQDMRLAILYVLVFKCYIRRPNHYYIIVIVITIITTL